MSSQLVFVLNRLLTQTLDECRSAELHGGDRILRAAACKEKNSREMCKTVKYRWQQ